MSGAASSVRILLFGQDVSLSKTLAKAASDSEKASSQVQGHSQKIKTAVTTAFAGAGLAVAGIGVASLKSAAQFQESMTALVTGAGESQSNIKLVGDGILHMAGQVGVSADQLSKGIYLVESAGYHGAAGLVVLKAAAEGAKVGNADLKTTADGVTTALTDYHLPAAAAAAVTSQLVATVAAGKTTMGDLAGSLHNVLPTASAVGLSFGQVAGAMATMTGQGIGAEQASQNLANTIRALSAPSSVAVNAMEQLGLNATDVAANLGKVGLTGTINELSGAILAHMGPSGLVLTNSFNQSRSAADDARRMFAQLPPSLQTLAKGFQDGKTTSAQWRGELKKIPVTQREMLTQFAGVVLKTHSFNDALKGGGPAAQTYSAELSKVMGGATGMGTALALGGKNASTFAGNVKTISGTTAEAGGHVKGFADTQKDLNSKVADAKAAFNALEIEIGQKLLPVVTSSIDFLTRHKTILEVLAVVAGGAVTLALGTKMVKGLQSASQAFTLTGKAAKLFGVQAAEGEAAAELPLLPWIAVIAAVGFAAYELYKHWDQVWSGIKAVASAAWGFIKGLFATGVGFIKKYATEIGIALILLGGPITVLIGAALLLWKNWDKVWGFIKAATHVAWNVIKTVFGWIKTLGLDVLHRDVQGFGLAWSLAWSAVKSVVSGVWNGLRVVFGWIKTLGLDVLHREVAGFERVWSGAWGLVKGAVTGAWSWISGKVNAIVGVFTALPGRMAGLGRGMFDFVKDAFRGSIDTVIGWWNGLQFSIPSVSAFGHKIGGGTIGVPQIPTLAAGGVVTGPTLAMVGEGRSHEAVIPLDDYPGLMGGPQVIEVKVQSMLDSRVVAESTHRVLLGDKGRGKKIGLG